MNPKHKRRYHTELVSVLEMIKRELTAIHQDSFETSPTFLAALQDTLEAGIRLDTALGIDREVSANQKVEK